MSIDPDAIDNDDVVYHLLLTPEEISIARLAIDLLISDEGHEPLVRALARQVLKLLKATPPVTSQTQQATASTASSTLVIPLTAPQMKIAHSALRLLLDDTQREQESERQLLWSILGKLPDEHSIRAITLQ